MPPSARVGRGDANTKPRMALRNKTDHHIAVSPPLRYPPRPRKVRLSRWILGVHRAVETVRAETPANGLRRTVVSEYPHAMIKEGYASRASLDRWSPSAFVTLHQPGKSGRFGPGLYVSSNATSYVHAAGRTEVLCIHTCAYAARVLAVPTARPSLDPNTPPTNTPGYKPRSRSGAGVDALAKLWQRTQAGKGWTASVPPHGFSLFRVVIGVGITRRHGRHPNVLVEIRC
ncbi:hypothetical protein GGS23DRAFT_168552 [Durotheca rogersii]|uniref:uncharacterized protein n=1 Tax=Durotheca rogersii TaxID=419775 RepID=UPI00221E77A2|nr:uncharacterized protein GGS23DRAFT_168552 [Durotheca rogersii]KAI5867269.1 hypothetical protein GGS23DRAFT_168552 [Durotheca rogersii]